MKVTCSKLVLRLFTNITFPLSENGPYLTVSPDQLSQTIAMDPYNPNSAELKLITFLNAEDQGKRSFSHLDKSTYKNYDDILDKIGLKD